MLCTGNWWKVLQVLLECITYLPDILGFSLRLNPSCFFLSLLFYSSELTKHNSTKLCQMLGSEPDLKMHVQNLEDPLSPKHRDPKTTDFWTFFDDLRSLMANILKLKHDIYNLEIALETAKGPQDCTKIFMNYDAQTAGNRTFIFTHPP